MDFAHFWFQQTGGPAPHHIGNCLRFRGGQYLSRTPASAGNRRTFTYSCWWKQGRLSQQTYLFSAGSSFANYDILKLSGDQGTYKNNLEITNPAGSAYYRTNAKYRDTGAWYHFVMTVDTTNATGGDRVRTYVNGERVTSWQDTFTPSQNEQYPYWNNTVLHQIGLRAHSSSSYPDQWNDGYMAEIHFVDGTALDPTDFGEFNADGVWVPREVTGVTYGTNGFYLDFSDPADIGADRSGNGNDFTPTGFELTDFTSNNGYRYDWRTDSPTNNTATLQSLLNASTNLISDANTVMGGSGGTSTFRPSTIQLPEGTGRYYWEVHTNPSSGGVRGGNIFGVLVGDVQPADYVRNSAATVPLQNGVHVAHGGDKNVLGTNTSGYTTSWNGDGGEFTVQGVYIDTDTGSIGFLDKNGVDKGFAATGIAGPYYPDAYSESGACYLNTSGPFVHTPPAGYDQRVSTENMPDVAITNPSDHFRTILDTGANILTNAQAQVPNGLWWIKDRANSNQHQLLDSVRGGNLAIRTPSPTTETAYSAPSGNSVAWCWSAPDAFTSSAGTIATSGSRNTAAGFSVISYDGNGANGATIGHGLSEAPEFVIIYNRQETDATYSFAVAHPGLAANEYLQLNTTFAKSSGNNYWNSTRPDGTVITLGTDKSVNSNGRPMICYAWHSVPGFSAFGSYQGNSSSDGPFIYTGFRPAWIMIKMASSSSNWTIYNTQTATYNPVYNNLRANETLSELTSGSPYMDIVSNGFKLRFSFQDTNESQRYIYAAFAEMPFGGGNVSPSPAR